MYSEIQTKKSQGYSRDAVRRLLGISWKTVDRYWDMTVDEYNERYNKRHGGILDKREDVILGWLERYPDLSAAQVQDWLHEHYDEVYADRTVRNFVHNLRTTHGILKPVKNPREYGTIPEQPPGLQLQADFGEYWALREGKRRIKLYFVVFILAHSRFKCVYWQSHPFKTQDFTRCLESCFEAIQGIPQELVIDQDKLMVVSENNGDIIHTYEFERCKNRHSFSVWLCRKEDPESKGMVESCVKYIKHNFAKNRLFVNLSQWSQDCDSWLVRTGNGKVHTETKKKPAEVFEHEKKHLRPIVNRITQIPEEDKSTTPVLKNNTIRHKGSRYSLPIGTYTKCKEVKVKEEDGRLNIYDPEGIFIDSHQLSNTPGSLSYNANNKRDISEKINGLIEEAHAALGGTQKAKEFIDIIHKRRGKYVRDQLNLILKVAKSYEPEIIRLAVLACIESKVNSASDFKDFAYYLFHQVTLDQITSSDNLRVLAEAPKSNVSKIEVKQRDPKSYMELVPTEVN